MSILQNMTPFGVVLKYTTPNGVMSSRKAKVSALLSHPCYTIDMLLALDTATTTISVALYDLNANLLLGEMTWQARRRHTAGLLPEVQRLLTILDATPNDLTALAVTTGPGSFSGVRAGIATVKGMALGLPQMPRLVGVPTLTVSAAPWSQAAWSVSPTAVICAVLQAGRGRYNWCFFSAEELLFRPSAADHGSGVAAELAQVLEDHAAATLWLVGEVDAPLREAVVLNPRVTPMDAVTGQRRAGELARIAAFYLAEGIEESVDTIQPIYLRAP